MELHHQLSIEAPAADVWRVVGERFMQVSDWASPICASWPLSPGELAAGATRSCAIGGFGPVAAGVVQERLTRFDPAAMTLEYQALEGMPRFVARAVNRWTVVALPEGGSLVRIHATLTLLGPARLVGWLIRWQMQSGATRVAEELRHFVERGGPHPRKVAAAAGRAPPRGPEAAGARARC